MPPPSLLPLARIFLRLGFTAFGGPAAHIAMMQREFVEQRGWVSREEFTDMLGIVNLIPGPNSTELAIHIGAKLGGVRGLWIAGICFILPAAVIVMLLAALYVAFGTRPDVAGIFAGVQPVVVAIILYAVWKLAATMARKPFMVTVAAGVIVAALFGVPELILLFSAGGLVALIAYFQSGRSQQFPPPSPPSSSPPIARRNLLLVGGLFGGLISSPTVASIFCYFLYIGSVLYGSGYVLAAFLHQDLVVELGWLSERQLYDAIAVGQVTPGPLFTTATFVGYLLGGVPGGIAGTVGIFLPSFLLVLLTQRWIRRLRNSHVASGFLNGVNAAAVGLIVVVLIALGGQSLVSVPTWGIGIGSFFLLFFTPINPTWLIAAGAAIGWGMTLLG